MKTMQRIKPALDEAASHKEPVNHVVKLQPCATCRWCITEGNGAPRCHANPPQLRLPYDNLSAWPVVPFVGGGRRLHEERAVS